MLHATILSGGGEATEERARQLAARAMCQRGGDEPCGVCRACRKVFAGIHPDVITVQRQTDDKGKLRREILVDQIRHISGDAAVLPNEGERKVYIVREADAMNVNAQNAFLKLLEEPPSFVLFFLCTQNPEGLLPTVRSRCGFVRLGEADGPDTEFRELARAWLAVRDDAAELLRLCVKAESLDTAGAIAFLEALRGEAADAVADGGELLGLEALFRRALVCLRANTGVKHVMGLLSTYRK